MVVADNWTRENMSYVAGLLEGEGCFSPRSPFSPRIQLKMTDEDVVRKAQQIAGFGNVCGPIHDKRNADWKPCWKWEGSGKQAYALMIAIYPWMGERRQEKIREVIKLFSERKNAQQRNS